MTGFDEAIEAELPFLRSQAEALMRDTCTIQLVVSRDVDDATGDMVVTYGAPIYGPDVEPHRGKCKVQDGGRQAQGSTAADADRDALDLRVDIPADAPGVPEGAVVQMADGRRFRVLAPHRKTWQTAQRLPVTWEV